MTKLTPKFIFKFAFAFSIQFNSKSGQAPFGPTQKALAAAHWAKNFELLPKSPPDGCPPPRGPPRPHRHLSANYFL